jgi:hypothetical protein
MEKSRSKYGGTGLGFEPISVEISEAGARHRRSGAAFWLLKRVSNLIIHFVPVH